MIVTLASVRGSPGVTSWTVLVAAAWPAAVDVERVVVEADLDGGVLGARYGLGVDPGVVSMIAALRRSEGLAVPVEEHGRSAGAGLWLVPGPESAEQARSVWAGTSAVVADRLAADDRLWLVDAGRVYGGSATVPLVQRSQLTVVVCRSGQEDLVQVPARVSGLLQQCRDVGVLVIGKVPYPATELGEFFGTSPVWCVGAAEDLPGVAGAVLSPGRARRSWVWRTALEMSAEMAGRTHAGSAEPAPGREQPARGSNGGRGMNRPDPVLLTELTRSVQNALVADATARLQSGGIRLGRGGQAALADKVLRQELQRIDTDRLSNGAPRLTAGEERTLVERVLALSVGLGPVELLLADESVEEVVASRFDLVFVYRSDGSVEPLEERLWATEAEMESWLAHLARTAGRTERQFNGQVPLLVMRLGEGLRLAATRDVSQHVSFALRRNTLGKVTLADLVGLGTLPEPVKVLLAACMRSTEIRMVFSGPTGSGKSTLVRGCLAELGTMVRVVIIEDTAELDFFDPLLHPNVESWEARLANNEGEGAITPGQQVKHALRYRPDWLVFGEVRDSDGAVPMLKAMTHGQSSLTTVHSATAVGALDKLALYLGTGEDRLPPEVAHHQLHQAVDFVVHLDRLPDGRRVVTELLEVAGFDGRRCTTNTLAVRDPGSGEISTLNRLEQHHRQTLARAGFDDMVLGRGFR